MPESSPRNTIPAAVKDQHDQVVAQTAQFCAAHLTEEYAGPCRELAGLLARKRPSPLLGGRLELWSCAVTFTIAKTNFLFERRSTPSIAGYRLCELFGTSPTAIAPRVRNITRWFRIVMMDTRFTPPGRLPSTSKASVARITISETLLRFFVFRSQQVGNDTSWAMLWALVRFQEYMDSNAVYLLTKEESAFYDRLSDPKSKEPREFCEIFGPEKIPRHTYGFTECHLVDELIGTDRSRARVRAAIRKLEAWLIDAGYVQPDRDRGLHRRVRPRRSPSKPREKAWPPPEAPPMSLAEVRDSWAKLTGRTEG